MPLFDNNPERRNLTVLSLSIIVFYLAGGYFIDNEIKLKIVNIGFHNREVLGYLVWVMLAWFLFKYWLASKGAAGELLRHDQSFEINMNYKYVKNYIKYNAKSGEINDQKISVKVFKMGAEWVIWGYGASANLNGIKGRIIIVHYLLSTAPFHRIATDYFMPYVFCLIAIIFGIVNGCSK
jgi:hypothetical protein